MEIKLIGSSSISGKTTRSITVSNGLKDDYVVVGVYINAAGNNDPSLPSNYIKIGNRIGNGVYLYYRRLSVNGSFSITSKFPADNDLFGMTYWLFRGVQEVNVAIDYPLKAGTSTTYTRSFNEYSNAALVKGNGSIGFQYSIYKNVASVSETVKSWATDTAPIIILSANAVSHRILFQEEGEKIKTYNNSSWQVVGLAPVSKNMFDNYGINVLDLKSYNRSNKSLERKMIDSDIAITSGRLFSKTIDLTRYVNIKNLKVNSV